MSIPPSEGRGPGDFIDLLQRSGYSWPTPLENPSDIDRSQLWHGTTVLAFHFRDGVIVAGDRRATAGNAIMYEYCDKVIPIDDYSLMAIAGVPATAFEMARVLSHNFEYYRRSQMHSLSTEGKVRALSRLLKENMGLAMQGVGAGDAVEVTVVPHDGGTQTTISLRYVGQEPGVSAVRQLRITTDVAPR